MPDISYLKLIANVSNVAAQTTMWNVRMRRVFLIFLGVIGDGAGTCLRVSDSDHYPTNESNVPSR